jgi:hypothetical protein
MSLELPADTRVPHGGAVRFGYFAADSDGRGTRLRRSGPLSGRLLGLPVGARLAASNPGRP